MGRAAPPAAMEEPLRLGSQPEQRRGRRKGSGNSSSASFTQRKTEGVWPGRGLPGGLEVLEALHGKPPDSSEVT